MSDPFWDDVADRIIAEPDEDKRSAILNSYEEKTRMNLEQTIRARINRHLGLLEKLHGGGPTLLLDRLHENLAAKVEQLRSEIDITNDQDIQ